PFFDQGGHSLLAMRLASRLGRELGLEVPLAVLFEHPTVAALTAWLEAAKASGGAAAAVSEPQPRTGELPPSFSQQRLGVLGQPQPGSPRYNVPVSVRLRGRLDRRALAATLAELVRRHEVLRTVFPSRGGLPVQLIQDPAAVPLPLVELAALGT